ncbi:hypothetical protein [Levilinea saccharolytica]|uniref:Uncharacterized protein n=1 Tax=Levilinea saccharolytica TaxID=229921 RepID=A0A0M8JPI3_9CHLR|nr:hypothetical protein [Levilinea saccharolytica]GAP19137.1 hypothetical protein LSAC_03036 [Levilinea saccharolytica]
MGRQVRFYMLLDDEQEFLDFVCQKPGVKLLRVVSDIPELVIGKKVLLESQNMRQVYVWDSAFSIPQNSIEKLFYTNYDENLGQYVDTERAFFTINRSSSAPFIEYSRSFIRDDGKLTEGRIWAEMYRSEGDKLVRKEPEFISWYGEVARWFRQNLQHDRELNAYVSRRAMEWRKNGGEFH